ncbi:MAG TPA: VOC family protein [Syntrophomonadaceae bacterium]|nr:VOC family protein [Syntrophomonadaceae bacterium]
MITGMHHIGIYCNNIEESIKFYEEVLGFHLVFKSEAMEGDKPLKMAFIKHKTGFFIELLEQENKSSMASTLISPNHLALRTDDADAMAEILKKYQVSFECEPFTAPIQFRAVLDERDSDVFTECSANGVKVRIFFFRGPNNERIEVMADNIGGL